MQTIFAINSTEDLKSKYKPGLDYYPGQTPSLLEAKKRKLNNLEPSARKLASGS